MRHRGEEGAVLHSANFRVSWGGGGGEWSRPRSGPLTSQKSSGTHCTKLGGPQGVCVCVDGLWRRENFLPPLGMGSWSLQLLANRYIDNTTPDTNLCFCTLKRAGLILYALVQCFFHFLEVGLSSAIKRRS